MACEILYITRLLKDYTLRTFYPFLILLAVYHFGAAGTVPQNRIVKFDHYTQHDGLSHSTVYGIFQDRRGFLWVSTQVGLNRFDGNDFKVYMHNPNDSFSLSANSTGPMYEDPWGYLWVGTWGGGLNRLDLKTGRFISFIHNPADGNSISDNRIHSMTVDRDMNLWIGTFAGGLNRLNLHQLYKKGTGENTNAVFERFIHSENQTNSISHNRVWTLVVDSSQYLWIGTDDGLCTLNFENRQITRFISDKKKPGSISDNKIFALHRDAAGRIWIGTQNGLNLWDPAGQSFIVYKHIPGELNSVSDNRIRSIISDHKGDLWVGTFDGGLNRYSPGSGRWTEYKQDRTSKNSISNNFIRILFEDMSGNLWIGAGSEGLDKLNIRKPFSHYQLDPLNKQTLRHNDVTCILESKSSPEHGLWIGTYGGGLEYINLNTSQWTHYPQIPGAGYTQNDNRIRALIIDRSGRLWIGTNSSGLNVMDKIHNRIVQHMHDPADTASLSSNRISGIIDNGDNTLWVATEGGGLNLFDAGTGKSRRYIHNHQDSSTLSTNYINFILKDQSADILWIGTDEGLNKMDLKTRNIRHYHHSTDDINSLKSNIIKSMIQDKQGHLWIATSGGGLHRFDPKRDRFTSYDERHGLNSNVIYNMLIDSREKLWMGTSQGLSKFDPQNERFRNYDFSDGLILKGFNEKSCYPLLSSEGEMFFGGVNGFTRFNPDDITENPHKPFLVLTAFKKYNADAETGRDITQMDTIRLDYSDQFFSFEFAALDFSNVTKNQYAYQLEGFDERWIESGTRRYVSYTNLDGGDYTLRIRGSNSDGLWNTEGIQVVVRIQPPFWQTWWFRLSAFLGIVGLIWAGYQVRIRQVESQKRKLAELVTARTAELSQKNIELEKLNEKKNEFLGIAAHDLRNPLGAVIGFLDLMLQDMKNGRLNIKEAIADLEMVLNSARQMVQLITELLDISAIESGKITLDMHPQNLNSLIEDCERIHRKTALQKNIRLIIDKNESLPAIVIDKSRISEVIDNLLSNAIKYTHPSGEVRLYTDWGAEEVRVHVQDSGQGLNENDMQQVFKSFRKLSAKPTGGESSTGFGLAIVKKLVELHHGQVWVESRPGQGSTFSFSIPVSRIPA